MVSVMLFLFVVGGLAIHDDISTINPIDLVRNCADVSEDYMLCVDRAQKKRIILKNKSKNTTPYIYKL